MATFYDTELENQKKTKSLNVALPLLAALEAVGTSIASKGQNVTTNSLGIYKDVQSQRQAALDRALGRDKATADSARQDKLLGFQEAAEGRAKSEYERQGATRAEEQKRKADATRRLLGSPAEIDPATGTEIKPAVPGVEGLTDIDRAAIQLDPVGWLTNKLKPQSMVYLPGESGFVGVPRSGGGAPTVVTGPDGQPVKPRTPPSSFTPVVTGGDGAAQRTVFVDPRDPTRIVDPNLPKPTPAAKPLSTEDVNTIKGKLNSLKIAKQQLERVKAANEEAKKSMLSGKGRGWLPTQTNAAFEKAVAGLKPTVTAITRVPGVGSMSDFETRLAMAPYPEPGEYGSVNDEAIKGLEELISQTEQGYIGMLPAQANARQEAKAAPAVGGSGKSSEVPEGTEKINAQGVKVRMTGGKWRVVQ